VTFIHLEILRGNDSTMAFSFGAAATTPAPAFGAAPAPAFGAAPAAAAPAFGAAPAAPAPAFGAAPAAAAPAFGAAPAAAPAFGAASAPAFGAAPAAAPATGFAFGTKPAAPAAAPFSFGGAAPAAPAAGGLFGAAAPAGGLFGAKPATGGLFGAPAPAAATSAFGFGTPAAPAVPQQQMAAVVQMSKHTPYASLPDNAKAAIDAVYKVMETHRRTMNNITCMSPALLTTRNQHPQPHQQLPSFAQEEKKEEEVTPLSFELNELNSKLQLISSKVLQYQQQALLLQEESSNLAQSAKESGLWQIQALAIRRGVYLTPTTTLAATPSTTGGQDAKIRDMRDLEASTVDRVEEMPSVYLWNVILNLESRLLALDRAVSNLGTELEVISRSGGAVVNPNEHVNGREQVADIVEKQHAAFLRVAAMASKCRDVLENYKSIYRRELREHQQKQSRQQQFSSFSNTPEIMDPFQRADAEELENEQRLQSRIRATIAAEPISAMAKSQPAAPAPATGLFGATAPAPTGLFGAPAAPSTGLFGAPAPAPAGGLFGAPAPAAPATGGLFGAPAPAAPAAGGLFGAPAPVAPTPAFGFGSTPAAPAFGTAPAAPAFGAPAAVPAGGLFGAPAPAPTVSTPNTRSKNKSSSSRRRK